MAPHCMPDNSRTHPHALLIWRPILLYPLMYACISQAVFPFNFPYINFCMHFAWCNMCNTSFIYELTEAICNTEASSRKSLLPLKSSKYYNFSVCFCSLSCPTSNAHAPYWHLCLSGSTFIPPHYLINVKFSGGGRVIEHKMCFDFL